MTRDKELSMIAVMVTTNRVQYIPPAYVAKTIQGQLSREEERRRIKRIKVKETKCWNGIYASRGTPFNRSEYDAITEE